MIRRIQFAFHSIYRDSIGVAEQVFYPDGRSGTPGALHRRFQTLFPKTQVPTRSGITTAFRLVFALAMFALGADQYLWGNPSTRDASKPLATHQSLPGAADLAKQAEDLLADLLQVVEEIDRANAVGRIDRLPGKKLAGAIPKVLQAYRCQRLLLTLGEPLGTDLAMRIRVPDEKIQNACLAWGGTPDGMRVRAAIIAQLRKQLPKQLEQYEKINQMFQSGQHAEAEKKLIPIGDELFVQLWFLPLTEREPYYSHFIRIYTPVDNAMKIVRTRDAISGCLDRIEQIKPNLTMLEQWGHQVADQLRSGGQAAWNDQPAVSGPEVLQELLQRYHAGHAAWQRIAAMGWIIRSSGGGGASGGPADTAPYSEQVLASEAARWREAAMQAAVNIIVADAASIAPQAIPMRHQEYVERLAIDAGRLFPARLSAPLDAALTTMVRGNSVYASSIEQYAVSTKDILIFRERIAKARATHLQRDFPPADSFVREATTADAECRGLYPENRPPTILATLFEQASKIMMLRGPRLIDQQVRMDGVWRSSANIPVAAASLSTRTYGTVAVASTIDAAITQLKDDLLVDSMYRPLTLDAAIAIRTAETGNFETIGGKIAAAQLESMVTRFASLPDAAAAIIPCGATVKLEGEGDVLSQMVMRLDIMPQWVHHRLFTVPVMSVP